MADNEDRTEERISINDEPIPALSDGLHIRGGVNLTMSNVRYNLQHDVVNRRDVANLLDSWIVDLQAAINYLKAGNDRDFHRGYQSVKKSMIKVFFTITTKEERQVYTDGDIL